MNDLTKEELESILDWADVYCEFGTSYVYGIHKPLIDKIQSMIDKYCDHEWIENQHYQSHCSKCGKNDNK